METLVLDGKRYVKASKVASDLGYTSDYVGQLCRSGQVRAHLVGRTWYVDEEQLSTHRVEKKRMARVKAREHAKKTLAEYRAQAVVTKSKKDETAVHIRYEEDAADLLPPVRRLNIAIETEKASARGKAPITRAEVTKPEPAYEIENPGEKIIMQGKLKLVDLNDGEQFDDKNTVVMVPRINRKTVKPATRERAQEPIAPLDADGGDEYDDEEVELAETEEDSVVEVTPQRKTFAERMLAEGVQLTPTAPQDVDDEAMDGEDTVVEITTELAEMEEVTESRASWWAPALIVAAALALTVGTLGLAGTSEYLDNSKDEPTFQTGYAVDFATLMDKI